jgi:hypothetical protein
MKFRTLANRFLGLPISERTLVLILGLAWIDPMFVEGFQPGFIASLPILVVAEFIFGHAGVGFSLPVFFQGILRWMSVLFVISLYGVFLFALIRMGNGLLVASFVWITVSRVYRAEVDFMKDGKKKYDRADLYTRLAIPPFFRVFFLMFCLLLSVVFPLPQFGLTRYSGNAIGSGSLVEHPESAIFLLIIYFAAIPWLEKNIVPRIQKHLLR